MSLRFGLRLSRKHEAVMSCACVRVCFSSLVPSSLCSSILPAPHILGEFNSPWTIQNARHGKQFGTTPLSTATEQSRDCARMPTFRSSNSSATSIEIHSSSGTELTWQSVFWALVPIALNSMIQPCGISTPSMSPSLSFPFRVSPIFCACDALLLLVQLAKHCLRTKSILVAFNTIARRRFSKSASRRGTPPTSLESLQEIYIFRASGFVFGVLPQAIKLYACTGLWWTNIWVSLFLLSFGILEAFLNMAKYQFRGSDDIGESPSHEPDEITMQEIDLMGFEYCVLPIAALQLACFGLPGHLDRIENPRAAREDDTWPFIAISASLMIASCLLDYAKTYFRVELYTRQAQIITLCYGCIMLGAGYCIFAAIISNVYGVALLESWRLSVLILLGLLLGGGLLIWIIKPRSQNGRISSVSLGGAYIWMLGHIYITCMYYATIYKPSSTFKPSWTNYLG